MEGMSLKKSLIHGYDSKTFTKDALEPLHLPKLGMLYHVSKSRLVTKRNVAIQGQSYGSCHWAACPQKGLFLLQPFFNETIHLVEMLRAWRQEGLPRAV